MTSFWKVLAESGAGKILPFLSVLWAYCALGSEKRKRRLEILLMQRKEVCEIKDTIIEFARDFEKKRGKVSGHLGRSQIIDELYRRDHSSRFMNKALKELLKEGQLKSVPAKMNETVYAASAKPYRSKTHSLTKMLTKMGVYSRAMAKHKPYPEAPHYDVKE